LDQKHVKIERVDGEWAGNREEEEKILQQNEIK